MEPGVEIGFFVREMAYNEKFIYDLVESLIDIGSKCRLWKWSLKAPATLEEQIKKELSEEIGVMNFVYKDIYYGLWLCPDAPSKFEGSKLGTIELNICESALNPSWSRRELGEEEAIKRCTQNALALIEIAKVVWNALEPKPIYGIGDDVPEEGLSVISPSEEEILSLKIEPNIYWLNFFGLELVKKFGKEKLLSVPAYKVEELNEGVLFVESPLPALYIGGSIGTSYKKICDHFGWRTYFVDIFDIERYKLEINGKEFRNMHSLKKHLERDINDFRKRVKNARIFVTLKTYSNKPVPPHVKEMEKWLREEMKVEVEESN